MNAIVALLIGIVAIALGYGYYAKTINAKIIQPDPKKATPAKMYMDGVDFTPANRNVLFGYQFKSIAALGPIVGPIVAVQWGPSLLAGCRITPASCWGYGKKVKALAL
jgi:carbon starvation protein